MHTDRSKINQTSKPLSTQIKPNLFSKDQVIQNKVVQLDMTNKKLLSIANAIMRTSFVQIGSTNRFQVPKILEDFEFQIRIVLQEMISSIKQYFLDVDSKLKSLCKIIQEKYADSPVKNPQSRDKHSLLFHYPNQQVSLKTLIEKVGNLQASLQKTQQNQKKLVDIIQGILQKHNIQEQPTMLKNDQSLRDFFQYKKAKGNKQDGRQTQNAKIQGNHNNPSQIYVNKVPSLPSKPSQIFSIHQKLSGLVESQVSEGQNHQQTGIYLKKVFARVQQSNQALQFSNPVKKPKSSRSLNKFHNFASINLNKKSLKPPNIFETSVNERKAKSPQKNSGQNQNYYRNYTRDSDVYYLPNSKFSNNSNQFGHQNKSYTFQEQKSRRFNFLIQNLNQQMGSIQ